MFTQEFILGVGNFTRAFRILSYRGHSMLLACTDDRTEEGKFFLLKHDKVKGEYICS